MYLVIYDDGGGLVLPMGCDADCEGAISVAARVPVLFPDRLAAQRAIRISMAFAKLEKSQGKLCNEDFIEHKRYVRIQKCDVFGSGNVVSE